MKNAYFALAVGVLAASSAAILVRMAQDEKVPSLVIAAGRLIIATLILSPFALKNHQPELQRLTATEWGLCGLAGVFLGLHFATWISSLEYTSVVTSVVLVTTNPLFVALLSFPLLGERVQSKVIMGIVIAFVGSIIVAMSGDSGEAPTRDAPILGNLLAVIGAVAIALYLIIGRRIRAKLSLIPYIWVVYGAAALVLIPVVFVTGDSFFGQLGGGYFWILALALFPQLIGHSSFNYALGYFPAAYVSLVALAEPIGSAILAIAFLGEIPTPLAVLGSAIILAGVAYANFPQNKREVIEESSAL